MTRSCVIRYIADTMQTNTYHAETDTLCTIVLLGRITVRDLLDMVLRDATLEKTAHALVNASWTAGLIWHLDRTLICNAVFAAAMGYKG